MQTQVFTASIWREEDGFIAQCLEVVLRGIYDTAR